ncbi:hypothetical protein AM588_10008345 [Phytophthora nicotianae]|uniref:SWIM-type domain-containing protein n=1 Tax=Phytophthora nicotianae TaxID=4792 RepID=A0A0W8DS06_PHYNI|nr:hypothetical protein AM588_10008345 [Phytophthora nicotianae]
MTYARSDEVYEEHRAEFKSLSMRGGRQELWDYFEKNWDNCKDTWVMAYRMELPHFNNHTNNRVESLFSKVKQHLKGHLTMNASLEALLYQRRKKEEYYAKVEMPGTLRDFTYSEEMNIVLGMTTKWVAAAIRSQYVAVDPVIVSSYTVVDNGPTVTLRNEDHECLLQKETFKCDCEFSQTMQLPCRHAMIWRKSRGGPFVVPFGAIGSSGELARLGDEAFDAAMDQFEGWWHNLRQGQISMTPCHEQTENRDNDGSNDGGNACGGENAEDTSSVAQAISGGGAGYPRNGSVSGDFSSAREGHTETVNGLAASYRHRRGQCALPTPEETVNRAFKLLSESRTGKKDEIQLDSDGEGVGDENGYVLVVEKVGTYSREQVEQMKWMWNMQDTCRRGVLLCTWLNNEVKTLVDEKVAVSVAFDNFLKTWPYLVIPGFGFDITYADSEVSEVQLGSTTPLGVSSVYF